MDISQLVRKPEMVHAILEELPDRTIVAKENCKIHFPVRFEEKSLAVISNKVTTIGYIAIIVEDKYYGICNIPATIKLEPSYISKVKVGDSSYYELEFEKGSVVFTSSEVVKSDILTYYIYNELIAGGQIPWYMDYSDLIRIFDESPRFAGVTIGANLAIMDMVAGNIARDSKDLTRYYRHVYTDIKQEKTNPPELLALRNISYGATNTTAKLLGSYFSDGLTSALINPSVRQESIEEKLRR